MKMLQGDRKMQITTKVRSKKKMRAWLLTSVVVGALGFYKIALADDTATPAATTTAATAAATTTSTVAAILEQILQFIETARSQDSQLLFEIFSGSDTASSNGAGMATAESAIPAVVELEHVNRINYGLYAEGISANYQDPYREVLSDHFLSNCSTNSTTESAAFPSQCQSNPLGIQHADLKISTLLGPLVLNSTLQASANMLLRNLFDAFPTTNIASLMQSGGNPLKASATSQQTLSTALVSQATYAVGRHSLIEMYANRLPGTDSSGNPTPSYMEIMANEATRRFESPTWYQEVASKSAEAATKELAQMQAFHLWLEFQRYRQTERVEALLAAQLGATSRMIGIIQTQTATAAAQATSMTTAATPATGTSSSTTTATTPAASTSSSTTTSSQ